MNDTKLQAIPDRAELVKANPILDQWQCFDEDFLAGVAANTLGGSSITLGTLLRVKNPSGDVPNWTWKDGGQTKMAAAFEGIPVCWQVNGLVWPTDKTGTGQQPIMKTVDGVVGHLLAPDYRKMEVSPQVKLARWGSWKVEDLDKYEVAPGQYDWKKLTDTGGLWGWGTGREGRGKWAREQRTLMILTKDETLPFRFTVAPASVRGVSDAFMRMSAPFWHYVVRVTNVPPERQTPGVPIHMLMSMTTIEKWVDRKAGKNVYAGDLIKKMYVDVLSKLWTEQGIIDSTDDDEPAAGPQNSARTMDVSFSAAAAASAPPKTAGPPADDGTDPFANMGSVE